MGELGHLYNKTVLVTGGTGTFGRAFVAKLLSIPEIKKIIVFSRDEYKQSEMQREIRDPRVRFFIGDVRDRDRLYRAFQGVDIVAHAAALKQVPALEYNPSEAVKTNIIGTQNVIDAALDSGVEKVLFVSSDKAVQPINLYGATKLCAEKLCVAANFYRGGNDRPMFSVMRYGNVLGSRGSLLELIRAQKQKGVVTLTDERMTRFWISVDRVMNIIMEALGVMQGGEIFVPKMKALKVSDVIQCLAPECRVETIGMRPGEKLHEVLITEYEAKRTREADDFFVIFPEFANTSVTAKLVESFREAELFQKGILYASNHPAFLFGKEEVLNVLAA